MDDVVGQDRPIADIGQVGSEIDTESLLALLFLIHTNCAQHTDTGGVSEGELALSAVKFKQRLERVFGRLASNHAFAKWIQDRHPVEYVRACRVSGCSSSLEYGLRGDTPAVLSNRCMERFLCQQCAALNAAENLAKALPRVLKRLGERPDLVPAFVTITMKNEGSLAAMMERFHGNLSTMLGQRRNYNQRGTRAYSVMPALAYFDGGIFSFEVKRGKGSGLWHLHAHGVVLCDPSHLVVSEHIRERRKGEACSALIRDWKALVGYYPQIDLQRLRSKDGGVAVGSGLLEVFKYCFKAGGLPFEDRFSVHSQMQGRKVIRPFGSLIRLVSKEKPKAPFEVLVHLRRTARGFVGREAGSSDWKRWDIW